MRDAQKKQIIEDAEIKNIKQILGQQQEYDNAISLRHGHLIIMTDQDNDGSHKKELLLLLLLLLLFSDKSQQGTIKKFLSFIVAFTAKYLVFLSRVHYTYCEGN